MPPVLPRLLFLAFSALVVALPTVWSKPAAADSFYFGVQSGHRHHGHRHNHGYRHHYGPRYHYGYHDAPPVYYAPPRVVYVPAPPPSVVYVPAPEPALAAVPTSPVYRAANGQHCREYQSTLSVGGMPQPSYGTACLQPDGSWRVVN